MSFEKQAQELITRGETPHCCSGWRSRPLNFGVPPGMPPVKLSFIYKIIGGRQELLDRDLLRYNPAHDDFDLDPDFTQAIIRFLGENLLADTVSGADWKTSTAIADKPEMIFKKLNGGNFAIEIIGKKKTLEALNHLLDRYHCPRVDTSREMER